MNTLQNFTADNTYICIDFDGTISVGSNGPQGRPVSTIEFLSMGTTAHSGFQEERRLLYDKYRPIELATDMNQSEKDAAMYDWWSEVFQLFEKYQIRKNIFEEAYKNIDTILLRKGMKDFFGVCEKKRIPVIVFSAGISCIIKKVLEFHNLFTSNISIVANEVLFRPDGFRIVPKGEQIIYPANKDSRHFSQNILQMIRLRTNIVVIGDNPHDVDMASHISGEHNIFSVGFLNYPNDVSRRDFNKVFDTVVESHDGDNGQLKNISTTL